MTGPAPAGLRVLHVIGGGDTGGAMAHLLPLLTALRAEGVDARLLCLGAGGLAEAARARALPVSVLPMANPWDARVLPGVRRALRRTEPCGGCWDVVHTHGMRANLPVRLVLPTLRPRPCLVTTVHSDLRLDYARGAQARLYEGLDRRTSFLVDRVVCVSADLQDRLVERGWKRARTAVVPSGLELPGPAAARSPARSPAWLP